ncbi:MAG: hypothetical protein K1X78_10735 [Verrucomicrobiaceae bacterium]|nr:hypothetical protein [Verrucomicrobiaceae bacterium]
MNLETTAHNFTAWLADVTLQSTLILAAAGVIVMLRPRMAAARRHFLLAVSLMAAPVLMLCGGLAPAWHPFGEATPTVRVTLPEVPTMRTTIYPDGRQIESPVSSSKAAEVTAKPPSPPALALPLIWLAGIGIGLLGLGKAAIDLRRLRRAASAESDARLLSLFREAQRLLNVALPDAALLRGSKCTVPMTWGWRHCTVLLPGEATDWSDARLRLVLRHELAHIARGDVLVTFLTTVSALLLWFHPLAWLTWRACNLAREQACDDLALRHAESSREDFADELLSAVTDLGGFRRCILPLALAMAASPRARALKRRLAGILDEARERDPWPESQRTIMIIGAVASAFALSGLTACRTVGHAAGRSSTAQVQIATKVIEITTKGDSTPLSDMGLSVGDGAGLQMIGTHDEKAIAELVKKLSRKKGVELLSAPSVTTKNKHMAKVEVVREFTFPSEFDPPKLQYNPPTLAGAKGSALKLAPGQSISATPTTPTAFEMRPVGVRMEVTPETMRDGSIDLEVEPELTEFEGFKNWGEPIKASVAGADGKVREVTLSENKIEQPLFSTRKIRTSVSLPDGHAVILGGLIRADVNDKTKEQLKRHVFFIVQAKVLRP